MRPLLLSLTVAGFVGVTANAAEGDRRSDFRYGEVVPDRSTARESAPAETFRRQGEAECERALRAYRESQECFARFALVGGGVKPEAFKHCQDMKQPPQCEAGDIR